MTEAVRQACDYVFNNSDIIRIYAEPYSRNVASCRVLEKAGFQFEGTLRAAALKNGKIEDIKMYAILKYRYFVSAISALENYFQERLLILFCVRNKSKIGANYLKAKLQVQ